MAVFDTLAAIPDSFTQGEVVTWEETLADYPVATHAVAYKFAGTTPQDGFQQFSIAGSESGTATYTFATPSAPKPGIYSWEKQVTLTATSVVRVLETGTITIKAGLSATPTTSFAAAQVALLKTALAALNATDKTSVSFNGQSFTRAGIDQYQKQLVYWQAQVLAEQRKIDALAGKIPGRITTQFVSP